MIFETKQVIDTPTLPYEGTINILCQKAIGGTGSTGHILADDFLAGIEGSISLSGQVSGSLGSTIIEPGVVTNAMIHTSAAIADSKLATISTANKVSNSATTATSSNVNDAIVCRDGSGNFTAGTISGALSGNATSATTAGTATNFSGILAGNIVGTQGATVIDAGVIVNGMISPSAGISDSKLDTISTGGKVANSATSGSSSNTPDTLVLRNGSGNFSAGIITASLVGNASTATSATSATFATTATSFSGNLVGNITGTQSATVIAPDVIVDAMISTSAAIADSKLATIATAGKVSNSATTATSANTNGAIVARDGSGNCTVGTITGSLNGNASTATSATTATTATNFSGSLSGDITGTQGATVIGSGVIVNGMISASAGIADSKLDTIAAAGKVSNSATTATSANTASAIVARDGSGNATMGQLTLATGLMLPTSGGTPTLLDFNETGTFTYSLTGPLSTGTLTAKFTRNGKNISIFFPFFTGTSTSATFFSSAAGAIPTRLRPVNDYDQQVFVTDNGTAQSVVGRIIISSTGLISIYKSNPTTNFTGSGTVLVNNFYASYMAA